MVTYYTQLWLLWLQIIHNYGHGGYGVGGSWGSAMQVTELLAPEIQKKSKL